jgi:hypothetical protein
LVAVFAMSAVVASAAFASEFTVESGHTLAGTTFTGSGTAPKFETSGGAVVSCETSKSTGTVKGSKEAETTVTYAGKCEINGGSAGTGTCTNVTGKQEIITEKLTIEPVEIAAGTGVSEPTERGVLITNKKEEKGMLSKFECTGNAGKVEVKGRLVCESRGKNVKNTNVFENKGEVVCAKGSKAGEQLYTKITGSSETFEMKATASIFKITEKDAQITTEQLTYSQNVKQT